MAFDLSSLTDYADEALDLFTGGTDARGDADEAAAEAAAAKRRAKKARKKAKTWQYVAAGLGVVALVALATK
jgi:hypothetical protein